MGDYALLSGSDFPSSGAITYNFCITNGIESSHSNPEIATSSTNFGSAVASAIFCKVALYQVDATHIGFVFGVSSVIVSWARQVAIGLSWWDDTVNSYYPTSPTTAYSNFYYSIWNSLNTIHTTPTLRVFSTVEEALADMDDGIWDSTSIPYPIEYVTTHCTASGPVEAATGADVVVAFTPNDGYKLTSVTVEDEAGTIPFIRDGDTIAFTMPGPIDA